MTAVANLIERSRRTRFSGAFAWAPTVVRVPSGLFFVSTGLGKFFDHAHEVKDFRSYEVPWPEVAVPFVGVLELVGGVLLVVGLLTRPAALALALNMIGALATAGRVVGGDFHLVYAPALLVCMVFVLWAGPGRWSMDERWLARHQAQPAGTATAT
jgi:putative oxidoreductase